MKKLFENMTDLNVVVLLTGTVDPKGMSLTKLQDVEDRKHQYLEALKYWNKIPSIRVVFVENSNTDISKDLSTIIDSKKFEFLTFNGNNYDKKIGKGYGELKCIEYSLINSKFIQESDFVFKVTGRYKLLNFQDYMQKFFENSTINLLIDFKLHLTFADSRFFGFTKNFINDYLMKYESIVNDSDGIYFENILIRAALNAIADGYAYRPLHTLPRIVGYSGSLGIKYNSSYVHWLRHKFKYYLKYKSFGLGHMPDL